MKNILDQFYLLAHMFCTHVFWLLVVIAAFLNSLVQFSRFLFPPLVEQKTYINVISLRKKGHATKRNNVVTCKNLVNYTSKGNGLHGCIT